MKYGVLAGLLAIMHFMAVFILLLTVFLQGFVRGIAGIFNREAAPDQPRSSQEIALDVLTQPAGVILRAFDSQGNLWVLFANSVLWGVVLAYLIRLAWRAFFPRTPEPVQVVPLDE